MDTVSEETKKKDANDEKYFSLLGLSFNLFRSCLDKDH